MKLYILERTGNCVKLLIVCFCSLISTTCKSQSSLKDSLTDSNLKKFELVNALSLPFSIEKYSDFSKYNVKFFSEVNGKTTLVDNLNFKLYPLDKSLFNNDYPVGKNYYYQYLFKKKWNDFFLLIIKQVNVKTDDYFFYINSFNSSGILLDHLKIAGQKIDDYDIFCNILTNGNIQIRTVKPLPPFDSVPVSGLETIDKYFINLNGYFIKIDVTQKKGFFDIKDDKIIRVD